MARTQAADYDQKRETITEHAARLFALRGFASTSVAEIAAECAMSKSLIYHYCPSKEDILFEVMNEHIEAVLSVVEASSDAKNNPKAALRDLTRRLLRLYVGAADRQKILLYELSFLPKEQRNEIVAKQRKIVERVEAMLALALPALKRTKGRLSAKTMLYFGMLNWTHTWFKASGPLNRDGLADLATDTILGAP